MSKNLKKFFVRNRYLISILAASIVVRLFLLTHDLTVWWDSGVYIGMSKYIYSLGSSGMWEVIRPPMLPFILGFFWKLGLDIVSVGRLIELSFSIGSIYMVYLIGRRVFNKWTGLVSALVFSIVPFHLFFGTKILTGIPSTFFALVALYFFLGERYFHTGMFAGISFLTRFPNATLIPILILSLFLFKYRRDVKKGLEKSVYIIIPSLVVTVPYLIFSSIKYDSFLYPFYRASYVASQNAWVYPGTVFFYIENLIYEMPALIFILPAIYFLYKDFNRDKGVIVLLLSVYLLYFTYFPNKQVRFAMTFLPYLCILSGYGFVTLTRWKGRNVKTMFTMIFAALLIASIPAMSDYYGTLSSDKSDLHNFHSSVESLEGDRIMTNIPEITAFTDAKVEMIYKGMIPPHGHRNYTRILSQVDHVTLNTCIPACRKNQEECVEGREKFFDDIRNKGKVIFEKEINGCEYLVLKSNTSEI